MTPSNQTPANGTFQRRLQQTLRAVPDFPQPGIMFQDITPVLGDAALFADVIAGMAESWTGAGITHVAGIESRGFILAAPIALALGAGLIPIRKPGKLPSRSIAQDYALEYGSGRLEMHADACTDAARVLIVDDVLATGGTARAGSALVESLGGTVVGFAFLLTIAGLDGASRLTPHTVRSLLDC